MYASLTCTLLPYSAYHLQNRPARKIDHGNERRQLDEFEMTSSTEGIPVTIASSPCLKGSDR